MALETIFRTSDGREFTNFTDAKTYEDKIQNTDDLKYYTVSFLFEGKKTYKVLSINETLATKKAYAYLKKDILNSLNGYNTKSSEIIKVEEI